MKKIIIAGVIAVIISIANPVLAVKCLDGQIECNKKCIPDTEFCLNVSVGNIETMSLSNIFADYIIMWYNFIIGAIGILATVMIMYGGLKWLTSRGNSAVISNAKEKIFSALIGLVLVFLSYTILYLVNPNLVVIKTPNIGQSMAIKDIEYKIRDIATNTRGDNEDFLEGVARDTTNENLLEIIEKYPKFTWLWVIMGASANTGDILGDAVSQLSISNSDGETIQQMLEERGIVTFNERSDINPTAISGVARIGNIAQDSYGSTIVYGDYTDANTFVFYGPGSNSSNELIDNFAESTILSNLTGYTTETVEEKPILGRNYDVTYFNDGTFTYTGNDGTLYQYPVTVIRNRANEGEWTIIFKGKPTISN
ncbi:MAG TPA: pilin [bacterium]|nr:pilin [bacterium]HNS34174.1 pilin [bacterium]HNZ73157.1 pilin [bacterium]HOH67635.1 pilin [bacterium]